MDQLASTGVRFEKSYDSGKNREQLIDLKNDPGEMKNLADDKEYQEILHKHRGILEEWVESTGDKIGAEHQSKASKFISQ